MLHTLLLPLEQFRNYCGPAKDREEWFSLRENTKRPVASVTAIAKLLDRL